MKDARLVQLAQNLVHYSCKVKPGERVLIESNGLERDFVTLLVKAVYDAGGLPFVNIRDASVERALLLGAIKEQIRFYAEYTGLQMEGMDCYIGVRSGENSAELSDVPEEKMELYSKYYVQPVQMQRRVAGTRWVVLRYPSASMAQMANMSLEAFEDYYFDVCCLDYGKMSTAMDALVARMEKCDEVHIVGQGTDLHFSIAGIPVIKCDGELNIPDGEVYTAPVKNSVNGVITYNAPSLEEGFTFENIRFVFESGKIVEATANDSVRLNKLLDVDEGARYVGEFAIGVNPYITKP